MIGGMVGRVVGVDVLGEYIVGCDEMGELEGRFMLG